MHRLNCECYLSVISSVLLLNTILLLKDEDQSQDNPVLVGKVYWCLMPLSKILQLYRGNQFYWWRKSEYTEKTTDLPQDTDKFNVVSSTPLLSKIRTHNISGDRH